MFVPLRSKKTDIFLLHIYTTVLMDCISAVVIVGASSHRNATLLCQEYQVGSCKKFF